MENSTNINDILQAWSFSGVQQLDITSAVVNFLICMIMAFVLRRFYISRSFSLTGKSHIGSIIPILSGVVFLVIIVVKSSLALSLGLVGALSIVRFRTPVKEPEELVYLFLAIAIGLGYAAGHVIITTIIVTLIMIMIYFWLSNRNITKTIEYNMVITWSHKDVNFNDVVDSFPLSNGLVNYRQKIMELKFDASIKDYVTSLIKDLNMTPKRHSKYLVGLAHLGKVSYI